MRALILAAALAACDVAGRPAAPPVVATGIYPETSTGDDSTGGALRLDLPDHPPLPDLPSEETTTGETPTTTAEGTTDDTSTGGETSTGDQTEPGSTGASTGSESSSTGGETSSSSTGEEPEPACGDGVCDPAERAPCWGEGWCFADCVADPACESDCACTPEAAAVMSFCFADPPPACEATKPGGYCDPNGDGQLFDADNVRSFYEWQAKCA